MRAHLSFSHTIGQKMNKNIIREIKSLVGDVKCPLNYNKDYELLWINFIINILINQKVYSNFIITYLSKQISTNTTIKYKRMKTTLHPFISSPKLKEQLVNSQ